MKNKRFNWKNILNSMIGVFSIVLVAIVIGLSFVSPVTNVKASISKDKLINEYNIQFKSAKTKYMVADGFNFSGDYEGYEYKYLTPSGQFYSKTNVANEFNSQYGEVSLQVNNMELMQYIARTKVPGTVGYIPNGVTHFRNVDNELEPIFYDEIDDNDFVILADNYNVSSKSEYNVENFYLSFGAPGSDLIETTKLSRLTVTGVLRTATEQHILNLDAENYSPYIDVNSVEKPNYYWYQYFDLHNVTAKTAADPNAPTYKVHDPSGKYTITFDFDRITNDGKFVSDTFVYNFYLLDSADYSDFPTLENTTLGASNKNLVNEYFYNFASEKPVLTYNPSKYNLSYTRDNNEITESITSTFSTSKYTVNGVQNNFGKITYYNNGQFLRHLFILTSYSQDNTMLEYLYLSTDVEDLSITSYNKSDETNTVVKHLNNDKLKFEYKLVTTLDETSDKGKESVFETITYKTIEYDNLPFLNGDRTTLDTDHDYTIYKPSSSAKAQKVVVVYDALTYYYNKNTQKLYTSASLTTEVTGFGYTVDATNNKVTINDTFLAGDYQIITNTHGTEETSDDTLEMVVQINNTYYLHIENGTNIATLYTDETHTSPSSDFTFTYNYTNGEITILDGELINRTYSTHFIYNTAGKTTDELKSLLTIDKIDIDYSYDLTFDKLGVYQFKYNYVCPWLQDNLGLSLNTIYSNNSDVSTNVLSPYDYTLPLKLDETYSNVVDYTKGEGGTNSDLYLIFSGYLSAENRVTINSRTYEYNPANSTVKVVAGEGNSSEQPLNTALTGFTKYGVSPEIVELDTTFTIDNMSDGIKLNVKLKIGTSTTYQTTTYKYSQNSGAAYFYDKMVSKTEISYQFVNNFKSSIITDSVEGDDYFHKLVVSLENHLKETNNSTETYSESTETYKVLSTEISSHKLGEDKLSIFGSVAYFTKPNPSTDSGYSILEQIDYKENKNFISDFTSLYLKKNGIANNKISTHTPTEKFSTGLVGDGEGQIPLKQIIVTDTQVFWKNYSAMEYEGKVSLSRIYRYTNYKNTAGQLDLENATSEIYDNNNTYFKDIYCKDDGYYEVIIRYSYNYYKEIGKTDNNTVYFYQLFVFIVDNHSPALNFEVETDEVDAEGNPIYEPLLPSSYTNKVVRISWLVPTYFQNNIYIQVDKRNFDGVSSDMPFTAKFDGENATGMIPTLVKGNGDETYVKSISTFTKSPDKSKYYVTFRLPADRPTWNLDGHYYVTIFYGTENVDGTKPNVTLSYTSDNKKISGMQTLPIMLNDQGYYVIDDGFVMNSNQQIINSEFTFRYSPKASGAPIYTYWHEIDFNAYADYDRLINLSNSKIGITTTQSLFGTDSEIEDGTFYDYGYETTNRVQNGNTFPISDSTTVKSSSKIYFFRMKDAAGNEARYVIFYDITSPRTIVDPKPNNPNNIVSDVTTITWGDYKAIKVTADDTLSLYENINEYTKLEYTAENPVNRLKEALSYINSSISGQFNDTKLEKVGNDYYILIPVDKAQITDEEGRATSIQNISKYYFFPTNPLETSTSTITLPKYDADGKIIVNEGGIVFEELSYEPTNTTINSYSLDDNKTRDYISTVYGTSRTKLSGVSGTGLYYYSIYDRLGNKALGDLWMNLDKTQTMAKAIFNSAENLTTTTPGLTGESAASYAASKLYISSLVNIDPSSKVIPDYTLSYTYHAYDATFYENYTISGVEFIDSVSAEDLSTYLRVTFKHNKNATDPKVIDIRLTNEDGNTYKGISSYPYSMLGEEKPNHIYKDSLSDVETENNGKTKRVHSSIINQTKDTLTGNSITKDGLYVFKREYSKGIDEESLGTDTRIIYRIYYIDRNGIINVPASTTTASSLYNIGSDINFLLGSTYIDKSNQKLVTASDIQSKQVSQNSNEDANSNYRRDNVFTTNKVETKFTLTTDKYNFAKFYNQYASLLSTYPTLEDKLTKSILNKESYERIFKVDLTLSKGQNATKIIDETNDNVTSRYNAGLMKKYISEYKNSTATNYDSRLNENSFFYGDLSNSYYITLSDKAGHILREANDRGELEVKSYNHNPNQLLMTFNIQHKAPAGDFYGKYYGEINYDEDNGGSSPSIPITTTDNGAEKAGSYALISHYMNEDSSQIKLLSKEQDISTTKDGSTISVLSTNNETLVFLFAVTDSDYVAKIDINNIQIYQNQMTTDHLLFNRQNGINYTTSLVPSQARQDGAFICNVVNDPLLGPITYYAIIIFDNNLDQILNPSEIESYSNFRLLDAEGNIDFANYYIKIHYIGEKDDYQADLNGTTVSYYESTYQITVDRIKPMYNLVNLMKQDKYTYKKPSAETDYEKLFNEYSQYYNFKYNEETDFYNSDLENHFFALDTRPNSSFVFKSVDKLDSVNGFYIRPLGSSIKDYKFSYTPDDYTIYYNAQLRGEHKQFIPSNAETIMFDDSNRIITPSSFQVDNFYYCPYIDGEMSANHLLSQGIIELNKYYEIIEVDEAGNYRVYAVYTHNASDDTITAKYQAYSGANYITTSASYTSPNIAASGIAFDFLSYNTKDLFIKTILDLNSIKLKETTYIYYDPIKKEIRQTDINNNVLLSQTNVNTTAFMTSYLAFINKRIVEYKDKISDKNSPYYSEYGYTLSISIVDRLGIPASYDNRILNNFEISYSVAGSEIVPIFKDFTSNFTITIPSMKGSTYITEVLCDQFNIEWHSKAVDSQGNLFKKTVNEFKTKGAVFTLTKGVYRFTITDNFGRKSVYFHEYGVSSSQTGGSFRFYGKTSNNISNNPNYITYTADTFTYTYDSSVYDVYIKYTGLNADTLEYNSDLTIYGGESKYTIEDLRKFGIQSIITNNSTTTITFAGVDKYSAYFIKTLLASTASNYTWGAEESDTNLFVYNYRVTIYKAIPSVNIRNMKGMTLPTDTHLNLTEDFQLILNYYNMSDIDYFPTLDFYTYIRLTRKYTENNITRTVTQNVTNGFTVTLPGEYTATAVNNLGQESATISFTRGDGEITMYAVYAISNQGKNSKILEASSYTDISQADNKTQFHYFITDDYFSYYDTENGSIITKDIIYDPAISLSQIMAVYKQSGQYLDVRVNSNLNLIADIVTYEYNEIDADAGQYEYIVKYQVYSNNPYNEAPYIYRYIVIHFLPATTNKLIETSVTDVGTTENKLLDNENVVQSVSTLGMSIKFTLSANSLDYQFVKGNTLYLDRYYNNELIETIKLEVIDTEAQDITYTFNIKTVGLHQFAVRDLAGRKHIFSTLPTATNNTSLLYIYLINQILYEVNGETPINNQVFNSEVSIQIISTLEGINLYDTRSLGIAVYKNGNETSVVSDGGLIKFNEPGFYTVSITATTELTSSTVANQEISSTYSFAIVRTDLARNSFNVSKGSNFIIDKVIKIIANERYDLTEEFKKSPNGLVDSQNSYSSSLIWLSFAEQQNSKFEITLKALNSITNKYDSFTFSLWLNDEKPVILTNIKDGVSTKEIIELYYNPGLIYEQVGSCTIQINGVTYAVINDESEVVVNTLTMESSGTYFVKIIADDGTVLSSYRFTKNEPLNAVTKIVLISAGIGVVVVIVLFFLIRKKGRYR